MPHRLGFTHTTDRSCRIFNHFQFCGPNLWEYRVILEEETSVPRTSPTRQQILTMLAAVPARIAEATAGLTEYERPHLKQIKRIASALQT